MMKKKDHMASLFAAAETLSTFKLAGSRRLHYPRLDLSCRSHDDSSFCGHRGEFVVIPEKPTLRKAFSVAAKTRTSSVALGGAEAESVSVIPAKAEIQTLVSEPLDSPFRGNDDQRRVRPPHSVVQAS